MTFIRATVSRSMFAAWLVAGLWLALPAAASAHESNVTPSTIAGAWVRDPLILIGVFGLAVAYIAGLVRSNERPSSNRNLAFLLALESLLIALCSPVEALGDALISGHMTQHLVLISITAPLLAVAAPINTLLAALPRGLGDGLDAIWQRLREFGASPQGLAIATLIFTVSLWMWHIPSLYDEAVTTSFVHAAEHLTLVLAAALFWGAVLLNPRPTALVGVFVGAVQCSILGALLLLAHTAWYGAYQSTTAVWGLSPLEDQQLAGVVMWVPGGLIYLAVAAWLFLRLLEESDDEPSWQAQGIRAIEDGHG